MTRRFSCILIVSLLAGCDSADFDAQGGEETGDSEPCFPGEWTQEADWKVCDESQGVQFCYPSDEEGVYGACIPEDNCNAGEIRGPELQPNTDGCEGLYEYCRDFGDGVTQWFKPECSTPLVLVFGDQPIAYNEFLGDAQVAAFAPGGDECVSTDWPSVATPWLVLDRDHNGKIDGGHELFGSGTRLHSGRRATQGFEALDELDDNRDGSVDAKDSRFAELQLWADHNGDRRSQASELEPLSAQGVERLSVDYHARVSCDLRGNCGRERAAFNFATGGQSRVGEIVDVYLPCR